MVSDPEKLNYQQLYKMKKTIIYTGLFVSTTVALGYIYLQIRKGIRDKRAKQFLQQELPKLNGIGTDIIALSESGIKPTKDETTYKAWADTLYTALNGAISEDTDTIYRIIGNLSNKADLYKLIDAFGNREATTWGWLTALDTKGTLDQWFQSLLSNSEVDKINGILKSKNIDFQF